MVCSICRKGVYMSGFSNGQCRECGKGILSPHTPPEKYCKTCSEKFNICEQCGETIDNKKEK